MNQQPSADSGPPTDIAQHKSDSPQQPTGIHFPFRDYGRYKRCFRVSWYNEFPWLEYSVERDAVFCFVCRFFGSTVSDQALTYVGFRDWKHAKGKSGTLTSRQPLFKAP